MLGTLTDRFVQPSSTRFVERDGYTVITTPPCPDYHFGNYMVLRQPPRPDALGRWLEIWHRELAGVPAVTTIVLQWERPIERSAWEQATAAVRIPGRGALRLSSNVVLCVDTLRRPDGEPPGVARPAESSDDWRRVLELGLAETEPGNSEQAEFCRFRYAEYRALVEQGCGQWWLSARDGEVLGAAGLFWRDGLARFQEVTTRADARRRGVCTHLVHSMVADHLARVPDARVAIAAEADSSAERIYQRLGFAAVSRQWNLAGRR